MPYEDKAEKCRHTHEGDSYPAALSNPFWFLQPRVGVSFLVFPVNFSWSEKLFGNLVCLDILECPIGTVLVGSSSL